MHWLLPVRRLFVALAMAALALHSVSASAMKLDSTLSTPPALAARAAIQLASIAPIAVEDAVGSSPAPAAASVEDGRESVVQFLRSTLGDPYRRGATGDGGFDCSGLVLRAYEAAGLKLPRVTFEQVRAGAKVSMGSIRAGDLLFYRLSRGRPNQLHVAVYIGDGRAIHASVGHGEVREIDVRGATWSKHFVTAVSLL